MKTIKTLVYISVGLFLLAGCKTINTLAVPEGNPIPINAVGKKTALTEHQKQGWGHLDLIKDSIPGISLEKAYQFVENKKGTTVIVAVVDSGTDLMHEDLADVAWTNPKEKVGNGIDDDKNGYTDDVYGWNFLGGIYKENAELYRIIKNPKLVDEATYQKAKAAYDKKVADASQNKLRYGRILQAVTFADDNISKKLGTKAYKKAGGGYK